MTIGVGRLCAAVMLAALVGAAGPALARNHHPKPSLLPPDPGTVPYGIGPPPDTLYPRASSTATAPLPQVRSQVPVGRARPGVTPYELLTNRP